MPLYDYRCTRCGREVLDVLQGRDDPPPTTDEPCGAVPEHSSTQFGCDLERLMAPLTPHVVSAGQGGWERAGNSPFMIRRHGRGDKPTGS